MSHMMTRCIYYIYMIFNQLHIEHPENFNYVTILEDDITDFLNKLDYRDADNKEEDIKREADKVEQ